MRDSRISISSETQEDLIQEKLAMIKFLTRNVGLCLKLRERFLDDPELKQILEEEIGSCESYVKLLYNTIKFNQEMIHEIRTRNQL